MIDFVQIEKIVPNEGTLTLTFKKSKDMLIVCYAPKYKDKEEDKDFRPVTVTGTPEELNNEWNEKITEISKNERLLVSASASTNLSTRKQETEKALIEKSKSKTKGKTSGSSTDSNNSLFTSTKKKKSDAKKEENDSKAEEKKDNPDMNPQPAESAELKTEATAEQNNAETGRKAVKTEEAESTSAQSCEFTQPVSIF
jgi:PRTRC genetic system protein E